MRTRKTTYKRWQSAKRRVTELKNFHNHILVFIGFIILISFSRGSIMEMIIRGNANAEEHFLNWLDLNFLLNGLIWGIALLSHGLYAYRHKWQFLSRWEEKQVKKYMEEEQAASERFTR